MPPPARGRPRCQSRGSGGPGRPRRRRRPTRSGGARPPPATARGTARTPSTVSHCQAAPQPAAGPATSPAAIRPHAESSATGISPPRPVRSWRRRDRPRGPQERLRAQVAACVSSTPSPHRRSGFGIGNGRLELVEDAGRQPVPQRPEPHRASDLGAGAARSARTTGRAGTMTTRRAPDDAGRSGSRLFEVGQRDGGEPVVDRVVPVGAVVAAAVERAGSGFDFDGARGGVSVIARQRCSQLWAFTLHHGVCCDASWTYRARSRPGTLSLSSQTLPF